MLVLSGQVDDNMPINEILHSDSSIHDIAYLV